MLSNTNGYPIRPFAELTEERNLVLTVLGFDRGLTRHPDSNRTNIPSPPALTATFSQPLCLDSLRSSLEGAILDSYKQRLQVADRRDTFEENVL
jgi:hypothetical protein